MIDWIHRSRDIGRSGSAVVAAAMMTAQFEGLLISRIISFSRHASDPKQE